MYDIPAGPDVTLHMDPLLFATTTTAVSDTHLPSDVHAIPATQSALEVHEPRHTLVALHLYGVQSVGGASFDTSVWSPSHNTPDGTQSRLATSHLNCVPQSESVLHEVLQPVGPQENLTQADPTGAPHAPRPSQYDLYSVSIAQVAAPQLLTSLGYSHCAVAIPSQEPPHSPPAFVHAAREPLGCPITERHLPAMPPSADAPLHASHCPWQAVSQQTLSTQNPVAHSLPSPHDAPLFNFDTQVRADEQVALTMQSASVSHPALHAVALHRY